MNTVKCDCLATVDGERERDIQVEVRKMKRNEKENIANQGRRISLEMVHEERCVFICFSAFWSPTSHEILKRNHVSNVSKI